MTEGEKYWQGRWRDEHAENERLLKQLMHARSRNEHMLSVIGDLYRRMRNESPMRDETP